MRGFFYRSFVCIAGNAGLSLTQRVLSEHS
jgi:hypothetical protein